MTKNSLVKRYGLNWSTDRLTKAVKSAINKYGKNNFKIEVIEEAGSIEELIYLEKYYIKFYDSFGNGYNLTIGGEGVNGFKPTAEQIEKMAKTKRGKPGWSAGKKIPQKPEWIQNRANSHKKAVLCYDLNGNLIKEYSSIKETKNDGFTPSEVTRCCQGTRYIKKHKNHVFKFKDLKD